MPTMPLQTRRRRWLTRAPAMGRDYDQRSIGRAAGIHSAPPTEWTATRSAWGHGRRRRQQKRTAAVGRKPKFKIRLDGGLPITDGHPLGAHLSRGVSGRRRQELGRTAARDAPRVGLLHCRLSLMHPQFSCHPMGPAHNANTGSAHPKTNNPILRRSAWRVRSLRAINDSPADPNVAVIAWWLPI